MKLNAMIGTTFRQQQTVHSVPTFAVICLTVLEMKYSAPRPLVSMALVL